MLQPLLFLHLCAVAVLFAGFGMEIAVFVQLHRARTVADVRAATAAITLAGPLIGAGALLLLVMGVAMVYVGGYGWQPWTVVALILVLALSVNGPLTNGKRSEAIRELALKSAHGPITAELLAARCDRVLNCSVAAMGAELIAALYIMSNKPALVPCLLAVAIAAVVPSAAVLWRLRVPQPMPAMAEA